ncbi:hypothetical protein Plec18167_001593 [Paecilomyces lecythidis]|uniref:Zn(2)-C6 fungal-type domain-containing protein n=1 Tax=Paecilomyces lecythidis TaxID=3004212 RepID=A0ABR3YAE8_9EURO
MEPREEEQPQPQQRQQQPQQQRSLNQNQVPKLRSACDACQASKVRCSGGGPCFRCVVNGTACKYSPSRRIGRPPRQQQSQTSRDEQSRKRKRKSEQASMPAVAAADHSHVSPDARLRSMPTPVLSEEQEPPPNNGVRHFESTDRTAPFFNALEGLALPSSVDSLSPIGAGGGNGLPFCEMLIRSDAPSMADLGLVQPCNNNNGKQHDRLENVPPALDKYNKRPSPTLFPSSLSSSPPPIADGDGSASRTCDCYAALLRSLLDSDISQSPRDVLFDIDFILLRDQRAQDLSIQVLKCQTCPAHRPEVFLLLTLTIEHVICAFETALISKKRPELHSTWNQPYFTTLLPSSGYGPAPPPSPSPSAPGSGTTIRKSVARESCLLRLVESRPLQVGGVRVSTDEKLEFGVRLLRRQLGSLADLVQQLQHCTAQFPPQQLSDVGRPWMRKIHQRLQALIGRVELFECRGRGNGGGMRSLQEYLRG